MNFNQYRIMWVMVYFDLPTETKKQRKAYTDFRKKLMKDGFTMFQYSIYIRHCLSKEKADTHQARITSWLPFEGHVVIMCITDRQFGEIKVFFNAVKDPDRPAGQQLELF